MQPSDELIAAIERDKVRAARAMRPEDKLLAGPRLFDRARRIMADGVRHEFPGLSEEQVWEIVSQRVALWRRLENES